MRKKEYTSGTLIGNYIRKCDLAEHPLDRFQIGLLETTVRDFFKNNKDPTPQSAGLEKNYNSLDIPVIKKVGRDKVGYKAPQNIVNAIREYRYGKEVSKEVEVTDGDALVFYARITDELPHAELQDILKKHKINRFGIRAFRTLHHYFQTKGLLEEIPKSEGIQDLISGEEYLQRLRDE